MREGVALENAQVIQRVYKEQFDRMDFDDEIKLSGGEMNTCFRVYLTIKFKILRFGGFRKNP